MAASGDIPNFTIKTNSRACVPCGNGPTSDPIAMGTPAASCLLNSLTCRSSSWRSYLAASGVAAWSVKYSDMVNVGTAKICFSRMMRMVSSLS